MMNNRFSWGVLPNWLKWALGLISLLMIASLVFGIYLYQAVWENRTESFDQVEEQVLQETELTVINKIDRFHGENAYYTISGETENGEGRMVFYPFDQDKSNIITLNQSDMAAKETIRANWNNQCNSCTMIDIKPAVISEDGEQPAWEVTYVDDSDRYVMEYLSFSDGSSIEILRFNQLFNGESD